MSHVLSLSSLSRLLSAEHSLKSRQFQHIRALKPTHVSIPDLCINHVAANFSNACTD